ncbi:MAG: hypothetical protein M1820_000288 [Bogoriella megaspora]|nr:MAG: hypothetical protein M1820_000288 [Bogoriella megaspora]
MRSIRIPFFRIFYSSTYTVLFAILIILLAVSPGEIIYQCVRGKSLQEPIVIGGVYLGVAIIAIFVYTARLYSTRSAISAIPKTYIPIEPGEVGKNVRRMIVNALQRSQLIAWDSRPRDVRLDRQPTGKKVPEHRPGTAERTLSTFKRRSQLHDTVIPITPSKPPWGTVAHPGWSSPSSDDLPDLQFTTVISEFANLIEAKAVSLAPSEIDDGLLQSPSYGDSQFSDPQVVAVLQRPPAMDLRGYLSHLSGLGIIDPPELGAEFLALYEYARFSSMSLTEQQFRTLMDLFTGILTCMGSVDPQIMLDLQSKVSGAPGVPFNYTGGKESSSSASSSKAGSSQGSVRHISRSSSTEADEELDSLPTQREPVSETSSVVSTGSVVRHTNQG